MTDPFLTFSEIPVIEQLLSYLRTRLTQASEGCEATLELSREPALENN